MNGYPATVQEPTLAEKHDRVDGDARTTGLRRRGRRARAAFWLLAVTIVGLSGCRTDPNILALERENRVLDDQVWYLSDQLDMTLQKLESARAKLAKCQEKDKDAAPHSSVDRPSATESPSDRATPPSSASGTSRGPSLSPGTSRKRGAASDDPITNPEIVVPSEALPPGQIPKTLQRNRSGSGRFGDPGEEPAADKSNPDAPNPDAPKNEKPGPSEPRTLLNPPSRKVGLPTMGTDRARGLSGEPGRLPESSVPAAPLAAPPGRPFRVVPVGALAIAASADSAKVQSITLHRLLTGGLNVDGLPGDEGISVVIEPRDAQGNIVAAAGAVSLLVLDPALPRDRARVARWDLSARDVAGTFRRLALGASGITLELPWPAAAPQHGRLELFVRFTTSDRRELEAHQQLELTPPGATDVRQASSQSNGSARDGQGGQGGQPMAPSVLASHWETKPQPLPASAATDAKPLASAAETAAAMTADAPTAAPSAKEPAASQPSTPAHRRAARPEWSPYRSAL